MARPPTSAASGTVASIKTAFGRNAGFSFLSNSACPANGTVSITTSACATAAEFSAPSTRALPPHCAWISAAAWRARCSSREPMMMSTPARAQRSAKPRPSGPVPPTTATGPFTTRAPRSNLIAARRSEMCHSSSRRCALVSPGAAIRSAKSGGSSISIPILASRSTSTGLPVALAAARCGRKLSLPKRSGNKPGGRCRTAFVPRPLAEGASTVPSFGAAAKICSTSAAVINGMSAGKTNVNSALRSIAARVAISMAPVSPGSSGSSMTSKPYWFASRCARASPETSAT